MDTHALLSFMSINAPQLVGFILPPLVTVLNTDVTDHKAKFLVTLVVCFFVAIFLNLGKLITGDAVSSVEATLQSLLLVFTESQAVYRLYFKGSVLESHIEAKPV